MKIYENMPFPPINLINFKMREHSAWYSGDPSILANFYSMNPNNTLLGNDLLLRNTMFWSRQIKNKSDLSIHVPIAGDIAETSANFLFSEAPSIKVSQANTEESASQSYIKAQDDIIKMADKINLFRKINEAAETSAGMGGVYVKIAWDEELSEYPIPVIVQADKAIPEFRFGIMTKVTFWTELEMDGKDKDKCVYRLLETYEKGSIVTELYKGTSDRLGTKENLKAYPETQDIEELVETPDALFAVYIPNVLPNRILRSSCLGRSDYAGIEGLMDSLDETFTAWMKDISIAKGKILVPECYLNKVDEFNNDQTVFIKLDVDPISESGKLITATQFDIRADKFEKTSLNLLERIITSAGYSPQSFGLNIEGRAESGTALELRERKSFATKNKKSQYWQPALVRIIELLILAYSEELGGDIELDSEISVAISDGITNNLNEVATSVKMLSDAMSASTETRVKLIHPEWTNKQIQAEVKKINNENSVGNPDNNPDLIQIEKGKVNKEDDLEE